MIVMFLTRVVPRNRAVGLFVSLMLCGVLTGCGNPFNDDDKDEKNAGSKARSSKQEPATSTGIIGPTSSVVTAKSPTDVCDNIGGKQSEVPGTMKSLPYSLDGKLYCLSDADANRYWDEMESRARVQVQPLSESLKSGGSPEIILIELVRIGCDRAAGDFMFWRRATALYQLITQSALPTETSREWPENYAMAIATDCF